MIDRTGIRGLIKGTRENIPYWVDRLPELPTGMLDLLERIREGRFKFEWKQDELEKLRKEIRAGNRRTIMAIIGATLMIGCFILLGFNNPILGLSDTTIITWALGVAGTAILYLSYIR